MKGIKYDHVTKLMTIKEVAATVRLLQSYIRKLVRTGDFPKPLKITERRTAWVASDIEEFIQSKIVN